VKEDEVDAQDERHPSSFNVTTKKKKTLVLSGSAPDFVRVNMQRRLGGCE